MSTDTADRGDDAVSAGPSELSYRHANPNAGNESILLRFEYENRDGYACLLVDAGEGVSPDDLLGPDDRLVGVCLTHAHLDHYRSLPACVDGDVPLFTSPDTAAMLGDVLDVATEQQGVGGCESVLDALVPVEGWTAVAPGVKLHPLPAGHTPGATGYLVRFRDADGNHDVLVTGDFTLEDCAGYPGFEPELAANVEVLFLTGATAEAHGQVLTDTLGDALERAVAGGRTLVTAGALAGVHVATLLATATDELDVDVPVRLVGQGAKLYDALEYDHDAVELLPEFEDPHTCLTPGVVTVAGPEVPRHDSSYRIFGALKDDVDAGVVQLVSGGHEPVTRGGCHTTAYELSMHPSESDLQAVVEELEPVHTVVTHRRRSPRPWNDWPSCVWSPGDAAPYTLYRDGSWQSPPWMDHYRPPNTDGTARLGSISGDVFADLPLPEVDRTTPSLVDEGIDVATLRERVSAVAEETGTTSGDDAAQRENDTTTSETMSDTERHADGRLYRTARVELETEIPEEFEERLPDPDSIVSMRARQQLLGETDEVSEEEETTTETATSPRRDLDDAADDAAVDEADESDDAGQTDTDDEAESVGPAEEEADAGTSDGSVADLQAGDRTRADEDTDREETATVDTDEGETTETASTTPTTDAAAATALELDPLVVALLERHLADHDESRERVVGDAVEAYLGALIRGNETPADAGTGLDVELSGRLGAVLGGALDELEVDLDRAVNAGVASVLGGEASPTVRVALGRCASLLDATVDRYDAFDAPADVVEAAILWVLVDDQRES